MLIELLHLKKKKKNHKQFENRLTLIIVVSTKNNYFEHTYVMNAEVVFNIPCMKIETKL